MTTKNEAYRDNIEFLKTIFDKPLVSMYEVEQKLHISRKSMRDGLFPTVKVGNRHYIALTTLARWLS